MKAIIPTTSGKFSLPFLVIIGSVFAIAVVLTLPMLPQPRDAGTSIRKPVSDIRSIEAAINQYQVAYSHIPIIQTNREEQDNCQIMQLLGAMDDKKTLKGNSGTNIKFLDVSQEAITASGGALLDSWGHEYHIALDVTGRGKVRVGTNDITGQVAVWSEGPNGVNEFGGGDDIASWKY